MSLGVSPYAQRDFGPKRRQELSSWFQKILEAISLKYSSKPPTLRRDSDRSAGSRACQPCPLEPGAARGAARHGVRHAAQCRATALDYSDSGYLSGYHARTRTLSLRLSGALAK